MAGHVDVVLKKDRDLLGGLCDDVDGEIEMQSEGLTAALDALRVLRDTDRANDAAHATSCTKEEDEG